MKTKKPVRQIPIMLAIAFAVTACASYEPAYNPPSQVERIARSCPVHMAPVCKVGNSSRVRGTTQVVSCRCEQPI